MPRESLEVEGQLRGGGGYPYHGLLTPQVFGSYLPQFSTDLYDSTYVGRRLTRPFERCLIRYHSPPGYGGVSYPSGIQVTTGYGSPPKSILL